MQRTVRVMQTYTELDRLFRACMLLLADKVFIIEAIIDCRVINRVGLIAIDVVYFHLNRMANFSTVLHGG